MEESSNGRASPLGNNEPTTSPSTPSLPLPVDASIASLSSALPVTSNGAVPVSGEASSGSSDTGASTTDSTDPHARSRSKKMRKTSMKSVTCSSDRKRRKSGSQMLLQTPPEVAAPLELERPLLSDSEWEKEIAGFGSVLNRVLHCVTNRELVAKTAAYMVAFPNHSLRFQIKMKQRAYAEGARGFQAKLMLFYVLHEFLKSFEGKRLEQIQREWFQTVDDVINACAREIRYGDRRNVEENRKRVFKTLARWEELKLYPKKIKTWKSLVMGECKPRRAPVPLPRNETERRNEALDQLQSFELPPPSTPQLHLDRTNCPLVFERHNFDGKLEEKQHWRYTAIAFIDILSQCLGLSSDIALTACIYFHRVFDRGIYAKERYKFAAACLFLSAKASSKRMKLLRMVRIMYDILETPLYAGDEELLELERLQLLFYEMEVLQGINFELTTEMPFYYLRCVLDKMPEKFRNSIHDEAQTVLEELFFLPLCVDVSPQLLGEAAAYIATWNKGKDFKFKWCSSTIEGQVFNERTAKFALRSHRGLQRWKKSQQTEFDALVKSSSTLDGNEMENLKKVFKTQTSGLRLDPSVVQNEAEFTKKTEEDSKEWIVSGKRNRKDDVSSSQTVSRYDTSRYESSHRIKDEKEPRIKLEDRSFGDDLEKEERYWHRQSDNRDLERYRARSRSHSRSRSGDTRYGKGSSWSAVKYDSRARSKEHHRDRYDYDDYDDYDSKDRYRERKRREDKYESRGRSSDYDRTGRSYSSRDVDSRRESASYYDRRARKSTGSSSYRVRDSRSTSRSTSRSRSPREFTKSSTSKRKRSYSTRGHSGSRSRSSSRSYSRDRGQSYRGEDSARKGRDKKLNKYGPARSSYRDKEERPRMKQERSAA